jgi:mono/diheme cytochrome c family protein
MAQARPREVSVLRKLAVLAVIAAVLGLGVFWVVTMPTIVPASALAPHAPNLDNGKTMYVAGGCASCHATPDQDDKTRLGGGLGLKSPFGTFYAPNISSDAKDGVGQWSEANFVTAMVKGTSPDGAHLFPALPYASYQRMKLEDVRDLFAYLKTLPAVQGQSKPHDVPFPFNIRRTLGGWKFCSSTASRSSLMPPRARPGIAAPIWSTGRATAPNVIRRAISSAASSKANDSPAVPPRRRRLDPEHHPAGIARLVGKGHRRDAGKRHHAGRQGER